MKRINFVWATVRGTGWPIDGERVMLREREDGYALNDWRKESDEKIMQTAWLEETRGRICQYESFQEFQKAWEAGEWEAQGAFLIGPEHLCQIAREDAAEFPWTPIDRDDKSTLPKVETGINWDGEEARCSDYIMISFSNWEVPTIGRYWEDNDGGWFAHGDDEQSLVDFGLDVNAWAPLMECYKG